MRQLTTIAAERGTDLTVKEGGSHTKVYIGTSLLIVPRHKEINEITARSIICKAKEEQ